MSDSAQAAQRAEFRKLAFHILTMLGETNANPKDETQVDAKWLERALDTYEPMMDLALAEQELGPALLTLQRGARTGGTGPVVSSGVADRIEKALYLLRGGKK